MTQRPAAPEQPSAASSRQQRRYARSGDPRKRDARNPRRARDVRGHRLPRIYTPPLAKGDPGPCGCGCALRPDILDVNGDLVSQATSLGFDVIEWARESLLIDLLPWQEWLLIHALELRPNGRFRFRNVVVLVARQNGKSLLSQVLSLYSICVLGRKTVLSAAQDLDTAEFVWEHAVEMATEEDEDGNPVRPDVYEMVKHVSRVNGKKALILTSGERYKVKAANRKAGRGLTGDLIILDELREQQNWDAWGAITKTTQARPDAQVWSLSNAGDITSVVLRHLRLKAHRELGDPDGVVKAADMEASAPDEIDLESINDALRKGEIDELNSWLDDSEDDWDFSDSDELSLEDLQVDVSTLGLFEWSSPPGCALYDVEAWAQANPSMNYVRDDTSLTSANLKASADDDPEWVFRTENLCQWPEGQLAGLFPAGAWTARVNDPLVLPSGLKVVRERDKIRGRRWLCVDLAQDQSYAYVVAVGQSSDGRWQAVVAAADRGTDWLRPWLEDRKADIVALCAQGRGAPISGWLDDAEKDPQFPVRLVRWEGAELISGFNQFFVAVRDGLFWHNQQPVLDHAAERAAGKDLPGGRLIDRLKSPCDAAPLIGMAGAWWLSQRKTHPAPPPPAAQGVRSTMPMPDALRLDPMGV